MSSAQRPLAPPRIPVAKLLMAVRELKAVVEMLGLGEELLPPAPHPATSRRVLVVHGRNEEVKEKVARFLMKLGLEPILLSEEAARGRTIIEKLEATSDAAFAAVLLTGDDVGALASDGARRLLPRARQNVVLELGFALAKLGRDRVCTLYEDGVELPSDVRGVEYKPLDAAGAWKAKLAKELLEAGVPFDLANAL
jgi:predicted nucleotide-binding protein